MQGASDPRDGEAADGDWESTIKKGEKDVINSLRETQMIVSDDASADKTMRKAYTAWDLVSRKANDKIHKDAIIAFLQEIEKHISCGATRFVP